jgi:hypothetical protein
MSVDHLFDVALARLDQGGGPRENPDRIRPSPAFIKRTALGIVVGPGVG